MNAPTARALGLLAAIAWPGCGTDRGAGGDAGQPVAGVIDGECTGAPGRPRVLVYTYENMWRHLSNLSAREAIYGMCASRGFNVSTTNAPHALTGSPRRP